MEMEQQQAAAATDDEQNKAKAADTIIDIDMIAPIEIIDDKVADVNKNDSESNVKLVLYNTYVLSDLFAILI